MSKFDTIPVRLPSGTKAIVQLPDPFTLEDGIHLMNFLSEYVKEAVEGAAPVAQVQVQRESAGGTGAARAAEVPLWDENGEPWNLAAEAVEYQRAHAPAALTGAAHDHSEGGHHD